MPVSAAQIFPKGSQWKYFKGISEASAFAAVYAALIGFLVYRSLTPAKVRELVRSLEGAIYLRWSDEVYLLTGGC